MQVNNRYSTVVAITIASVLLGEIIMANESNPYQSSINFVENIDEQCTLTDGYVCLEVKTDDFSGNNPKQIVVPGVYMPAFIAAYEHFTNLKDLSNKQKNLKHYRIRFTEDSESYILQFGGLLLPRVKHGKPEGVILAVYGRTTKYWIDKKTFKVTKYLFAK